MQEVVADAGAVGAPSGLELLGSGVGQLGVRSAAVLLGAAARDVALLDETIYEAGQAAAAQQHAIGDLGHAQPLVLGVTEARRAAVAGLDALGSDDELLERAVQTAADRPELERVPLTPSAGEIRDLYRAAAGHADARLPA